MIVVSMVLVLVGAVTLVAGVFFAEDDLTLVYVSIASCLLAGLFLVIGIVRGRPGKKAAPAPAGDAAAPTWSGSAGEQAPAGSAAAPGTEAATPGPPPTPSAWRPGAASQGAGAGGTTEMPAGVVGGTAGDESDDDVTLVGEPAPAAEDTRADEPDRPAPAPLSKKTTKKAAKKRSLKKLSRKKPAPEKADEPTAEPATAAEPAETVTAPEASAEDAAPATPAATKKATAKKAPKKSAKKSLKKTAAKKTAAKKSVKKTAAKKSVKKTAAKKSAKKTAAKKTTSTGMGSDRQAIDAALSGISGVGPSKREILASEFGSIERLRSASVEELGAIRGISERLAERIHEQLR